LPESLLKADTADALAYKFRMKRTIPIIYSVLAGLAAVYAWEGDISMLHSTREHPLSDVVLYVIALPSSLSLDMFYGMAPHFFSLPFTQIGLLTLCAALQCAFLWWLSIRASKLSR
jgi:hypothetical protein